ncbi:helix-turn-helix transcriptional regulator [Marisediminicola sp. LYQ85]|uniref:helix-turn-helix transcriptional regulator n=1 Tax=Marisediminicola sp. LYQ85 TaxID=3391062 RepID=UPI0039830E2D
MADRVPAQLATDKLAFLLSLIPWLMDHDQVSVADAAAHFGVPEAQIRASVRLIAVSGVPGETSQYQHGDLFDIAWDRFEEHDEIVITNLVAIDDSPRFSGREAAALIAGLQYLSALPENADRAAIDSLLSKLARGSSSAPSLVAVESSAADSALATIRDAVRAGVAVGFDYINARGEHEQRLVDPLRIESVDTDWYLRGWDHSREAVRTFRLDRISHLRATTEPLRRTASDVPLPEKLFEGSSDDLPVTIEMAKGASSLIADYLADDSVTTTVGDRERTTIRVTHYHGLKRLIAGLPGLVTVVEPAEARAIVEQWATDAAARYAR